MVHTLALSPMPAEGNLIQPAWVKWYQRLDPQPDLIFQSWDTASSDGVLSDNSAGTTWLVKSDQLFLMDVLRQRMDSPILKKTVIHYGRQYFAQVILVGSGMSLIQDLRAGNFPVIAYRPEADKTTRIATASVLFETGAALLPEKAVWLDDLESELFAFPSGRHDDQVDSTSQTLKLVHQATAAKGRNDRPGYPGQVVGHRREEAYCQAVASLPGRVPPAPIWLRSTRYRGLLGA